MSAVILEGPEDSWAELIIIPNLGYVLHTIFVPHRARGKGLGRKLLERVVRAVPDDFPIMLAPVPDADCPIDVAAWYERHGFEWTRSGAMMERRHRRTYGRPDA